MLTTLLALYLIFIGPGLNLWRSLQPRAERPARTLMRRYWLMSRDVLVMLAVLVVAMAQDGHAPRALGFDLPLSPAGAWGLLFAAVLMAALYGIGLVMEARQTPQARAESERKLLAASLPWPTTMTETLAFVASTSLMTAAWEVLYRGFLLLVLAPHTGLTLAIVIAALAYGIGHGYKSPGQFIGSIVSAFAFTLAYAFTHSLWWLIAIHVAVPLSMLPGVVKARRRQAIPAMSTAELSLPG